MAGPDVTEPVKGFDLRGLESRGAGGNWKLSGDADTGERVSVAD